MSCGRCLENIFHPADGLGMEDVDKGEVTVDEDITALTPRTLTSTYQRLCPTLCGTGHIDWAFTWAAMDLWTCRSCWPSVAWLGARRRM